MLPNRNILQFPTISKPLEEGRDKIILVELEWINVPDTSIKIITPNGCVMDASNSCITQDYEVHPLAYEGFPFSLYLLRSRPGCTRK